MIYNISNNKHKDIIRKKAIKGGEIINQLIMADYSLPIPDSIIIQNLDKKHDLSIIERFIVDNDKEYQLRTENVGQTLRYSETSRGLKKSEVIKELERIHKPSYLVLLQSLPRNSLTRDSHSVIYMRIDEKIVFEIRAGIATHMARCGWPISSYYEIPTEELLKNEMTSEKYYFCEDISTHKENIILDCMDAGLRYTKKDALLEYVSLPVNREMKRIKKIYEVTSEDLDKKSVYYITDIESVERILKKMRSSIMSKYVLKFIKTFFISEDIRSSNLRELLAYIGFLSTMMSDDIYNSLQRRLLLFLKKDVYYQPLSKKIISMLINHAKNIKSILKDVSPKLSVIYNDKSDHILYWDLIPCKDH